MNIYIFYENKNIELNAKILLALDLIKKKEVNKVYIGYTKFLLKDILNRFFYNKEKFEGDVVFYRDIWKNTEVIIKIFEVLGFNYFINHEEDTLTFSRNQFENLKKNLISKYYFKKALFFFTISKLTKTIYTNQLGYPKNRIINSGSLRVNLLKKIKKKGHYLNSRKEKKILLCLGGAIFQRYKIKIKIDKIKRKIFFQNNSFEGNSIYDKSFFVDYHRSVLRQFIKLAKLNSDKKFILRIYPHDAEYIKYYKKLLINLKNIELSYTEDIFYCLDKASKVICAPDNVAIEAALFGLPMRIYFNKNNDLHKFIYDDHVSLKLFSNNVITDISNINLNFNSKKISKNHIDLCQTMFGYKNDSVKIISKNLLKSKNKNKNFFSKLKNFLFLKSLKITIKYIFKMIKYEKYGYKEYLKFTRKYKYSFVRFFFFLNNLNSKTKSDFINLIYKYLASRNFNEHSKNEVYKTYEKIDCKELELFISTMNKDFKNNFSLIDYHSNIIYFEKKIKS